MHSICYINVKGITLETEPELSKLELKLLAILETISKASHAGLDEIALKVFNHVELRSRRPKLDDRRKRYASRMHAQLELERENIIHNAKINKFIGPLTMAQENGHPF